MYNCRSSRTVDSSASRCPNDIYPQMLRMIATMPAETPLCLLKNFHEARHIDAAKQKAKMTIIRRHTILLTGQRIPPANVSNGSAKRIFLFCNFLYKNCLSVKDCFLCPNIMFKINSSMFCKRHVTITLKFNLSYSSHWIFPFDETISESPDSRYRLPTKVVLCPESSTTCPACLNIRIYPNVD